MKQYAIVIDVDRCIGCLGGCQVACKNEHDIPLGPSRSKLYTVGPNGIFPKLEMYFVAVMCQQCAHPACVEVCPVGACYKGENDGVIRIDRQRCIGCQRCKKACPYDAIIFNKELRAADKCDICSERRSEGLEPVCVMNCSGKAILFGDINDENSTAARAMKEAGEGHVFSLKDFGGQPSGRFILRHDKWQEPDIKGNKADTGHERLSLKNGRQKGEYNE